MMVILKLFPPYLIRYLFVLFLVFFPFRYNLNASSIISFIFFLSQYADALSFSK